VQEYKHGKMNRNYSNSASRASRINSNYGNSDVSSRSSSSDYEYNYNYSSDASERTNISSVSLIGNTADNQRRSRDHRHSRYYWNDVDGFRSSRGVSRGRGRYISRDRSSLGQCPYRSSGRTSQHIQLQRIVMFAIGS